MNGASDARDRLRTALAPLMRSPAAVRQAGRLFVAEGSRHLSLVLPDGAVENYGQLVKKIKAKGDLLVATSAGVYHRLPVGSNGQVLSADSTTTTGLAWAAAGGDDYPTLTVKDLWWYGVVNNVPHGAGWSNGSTAGTASHNSQSSSLWATRTGITTAGSEASHKWTGAAGSPLVALGETRHLQAFECRFRSGQVTNCRYYIGLLEAGQGLTNSATFGTNDRIGICFRDDVDTYWSLSVHDGTTHTVTATSVTPAADTEYRVRITYDGSTLSIAINEGTAVTMSSASNFPSSTTGWGWIAANITRTSAAPACAIGLAAAHWRGV